MKVPNKAFDIEYSTMWGKEMRFLESRQIKPTFVKTTRDYNIPVYKYKKTKALFLALAEFFEQVENEEGLYKAKKAMLNAIEVKSTEELQKALQDLGITVGVKDGVPVLVKGEE